MSKSLFILASASPRRLELLQQIKIVPDLILPPAIDETPKKHELPKAYATRMAAEKLAAIKAAHPHDWILASDTVVALGRRILPKAETTREAAISLHLLSGRRHRVYNSIAISSPQNITRTRTIMSIVKFKCLTKAELATYLATEEWQGKAGGYAIQGCAAQYISFLQGSYSACVGLSLHDTYQMLNGLGFYK